MAFIEEVGEIAIRKFCSCAWWMLKGAYKLATYKKEDPEEAWEEEGEDDDEEMNGWPPKKELSGNENTRFREACENIGMTEEETRKFSNSFHEEKRIDRLGLTREQIQEQARGWLADNRGKFHRSDLKRKK